MTSPGMSLGRGAKQRPTSSKSSTDTTWLAAGLRATIEKPSAASKRTLGSGAQTARQRPLAICAVSSACAVAPLAQTVITRWQASEPPGTEPRKRMLAINSGTMPAVRSADAASCTGDGVSATTRSMRGQARRRNDKLSPPLALIAATKARAASATRASPCATKAGEVSRRIAAPKAPCAEKAQPTPQTAATSSVISTIRPKSSKLEAPFEDNSSNTRSASVKLSRCRAVLPRARISVVRKMRSRSESSATWDRAIVASDL
mmetsp:Transcript_37533/g.107890  ORF Transcript_37533/g.107890 Transcript_37533/m.107890 type:complete len:261 (+) Transcript_37533:377-1159(+)